MQSSCGITEEEGGRKIREEKRKAAAVREGEDQIVKTKILRASK
jgi:hypothetical protein